MIVKIQKPIIAGDPKNPTALVYNQSQSFRAEMPYTRHIAMLFKDGELKVFHIAHKTRLGGKEVLKIGKRVRGQLW